MNLGTFTIQAADGSGYLTGQREDPRLTLSDMVYVWNIRYGGNGRFILSPIDIPEWRIDLSNAWDSENNTVGLWYDTGYVDAQTWLLLENPDESFYIQTPYESGRVITVPDIGQAAVIRRIGNSGIQKWMINPTSA